MFYDSPVCEFLGSNAYFYFFFTLRFYHCTNHCNAVAFFIQKSFRQTAAVFNRTLFSPLNLLKRGASGWIIAVCVFWHAERSCLAECPSLRGVSSPSTGTDLLTEDAGLVVGTKMRNQERNCN